MTGIFSRSCTAFVLVITILAASAQSADLLYHWKLDEKYDISKGQKACEAVSRSYTGSYESLKGSGPQTGLVSVSNQLGTAVRFDGIDDGINIGTELGKLKSDFTVCAWVRPDAFNGLQRIIATSYNGWGMALNNKKFRFTAYGVKDYNTKRIFWFSQPGQWYHLAVYFDDKFDCYFYVNGELKGVDEGNKPANESDRDFYIGTGGRSQFFAGCIDDVRVYKGKLTEGELVDLAARIELDDISITPAPATNNPQKILEWNFQLSPDKGLGGQSSNRSDFALLSKTKQGRFLDASFTENKDNSLTVDKDETIFAVADLDKCEIFSDVANGSSSWMINLWVNPERVNYAGPILLAGFGLDKNYELENANYSYLAIESDSSLSMRTRAGFAASEPVIKCGEWQMLTLKYDSVNCCCHLYRNARLVASKGLGSGLACPRVSLLAPALSKFSGAVDNFTFYKGWLSDAELKKLYRSNGYSKSSKKGVAYCDSDAKADDIKAMSPDWLSGDKYKDAIRVMSYNIHYGVGNDRNLNPQRTAAIILASGADVVGLNEVDCNFNVRSKFMNEAKVIAELAGMNYVMGPGLEVNDGKGCFGNVLLSKFPIVKSKRHLLCHYPHSEQRSCIEALVKTPKGLMNVFVTHLDNSASDGFAKQIDDLIEITQGKKRSVLLGDMNEVEPKVSPTSGLAPLAKKYNYAFELAGKGVPFTVNDRDCKIDFLFVSPDLNERVLDCRVYRNAWTDVNSDHYPVLMVLK